MGSRLEGRSCIRGTNSCMGYTSLSMQVSREWIGQGLGGAMAVVKIPDTTGYKRRRELCDLWR